MGSKEAPWPLTCAKDLPGLFDPRPIPACPASAVTLNVFCALGILDSLCISVVGFCTCLSTGLAYPPLGTAWQVYLSVFTQSGCLHHSSQHACVHTRLLALQCTLQSSQRPQPLCCCCDVQSIYNSLRVKGIILCAHSTQVCVCCILIAHKIEFG